MYNRITSINIRTRNDWASQTFTLKYISLEFSFFHNSMYNLNEANMNTCNSNAHKRIKFILK